MDRILARIVTAKVARALVIFGLAFAFGCTLRFGLAEFYEAKAPTLSPEVGIKIEGLDRLEIFMGGVHVGTVLMDEEGAILLGETSESAAVLGKFLAFLRLFEHDHDEDEYY